MRLAEQNLRAERAILQARIRRIEARLAVPAGGKAGRTRGYATPAERHAKTVRLQALKARLARADRQLEAGAVSVVRGGRALLRTRNNLAAAGLTEAAVAGAMGSGPAVPDRRRGEGQGLGERDDPLAPGRGVAGDQAARPARAPGEPAARPLPAVAPGRVRLPRRRGRRPGRHRGRSATTSACDPARGRWYIDASWKTAPGPGAVPGGAAAAPGGGGRRQPRASRRRRRRGGRQHPRRPRHHRPGPGRAARRHPRRAAAGRHHRPHRHRRRRTAPGPSSSRTSTSPQARAEGRERARQPTLARQARPRPSAALSRHPHRASSATGWSRWPPTRACPSSSSTPPTPPGGGPSTGSRRCGSITPRRPGTTRQRW